MNTSFSKLSSAVLSGVRRAPSFTAITTRRSSFVGVTYTSGTELGTRTGGDLTLPIVGRLTASDRTQHSGPTAEQIDHGVREWEAKVDLDNLTELEKSIHNEHINAVKEQEEMYADPVTGFMVYTVYSHLQRGDCCGNACRHCPYNHENVAVRYKSVKKDNGAFYC